MSGTGDIAEILDQIDMESWLDREGVDYKLGRGSRGVQANIRECPCCGNSNWKVYMGVETGLGNCFVCEKKFSKFSFIRAQLGEPSNRDVIEHLKTVAREQGWRPTRKTSLAVDMDETKLKLPESMPIPIEGRNLKYLENRSVDLDLARYFHLRYSHDGKFFYRDDGRWKVQNYARRIIIPVFDLEGTLVSFQGRDITGKADRKYLFPPGFSATGSVLYNGHNALGAEEVVMGEGAFDVFAIKRALDEQTELRRVVPIGSFGKHLSSGDDSSQLARLLQLKDSGLRRVTFMWDGELKAIQDAVEAALLVRRHGLMARLAILPAGRDPNEVAPSVLREAYWRAEVVTERTAVRMKLARRVA